MTTPLNEYKEYLERIYREFSSEINSSLGNDIDLIMFKLFVRYRVNEEDGWKRLQKAREVKIPKSYNLPESDSELISVSRQNITYQLANSDQLTQNAKSKIQRILSILDLPLKSRALKAQIKEIRARVEIEKNRTWISLFEENLLEVLNVVFDSTPNEVQVCEAEVVLGYCMPEAPKTPVMSNFKRVTTIECSKCKSCQTTAHAVYKCSGCFKAHYCNQDCQRTNWKAHKIVCKK